MKTVVKVFTFALLLSGLVAGVAISATHAEAVPLNQVSLVSQSQRHASLEGCGDCTLTITVCTTKK